MASQGPIGRAVAAALRGTSKKDDRDEAARALARRYAALIDSPGIPARYRKHLDRLAQAVAGVEDPGMVEAYEKIEEALSAQTTLSDLGPKLLAVLASLGLTTAARGIVDTPKAEPTSGSTVARGRDEVAQKRRQRERERQDTG